MSTAIVVATFLGIFAFSSLTWAWLLRVGLRLSGAPPISLRRAYSVFGLICVVQLLVMVGHFWLNSSPDPKLKYLLLFAAEIGVLVLTCVVIIALICKAKMLQAFVGWLVAGLSVIPSLALVIVLVRPFILEAYTAPTNSMAPTLLGIHQLSSCPVCGKPAYSPPLRDGIVPSMQFMICEGYHASVAQDVQPLLEPADRFLVMKVFSPQRFDIAAFRNPSDPTQIFVKRVIGLPGEKIELIDGKVVVDGKELALPESLQNLQYDNEIRMNTWAQPGRPAILGDDEYFVLGDFSKRSSDSRNWNEGAPGHPAYAVPASNFIGVVSHIYWPPSRMRILR